MFFPLIADKKNIFYRFMAEASEKFQENCNCNNKHEKNTVNSKNINTCEKCIKKMKYDISNLSIKKKKKKSIFINNESQLRLEKNTSDELDLYLKELSTKITKSDCENFKVIYKNYLKSKNKKINWSKVKRPDENLIAKYKDLENFKEEDKNIIDKVAILKLNGGLGTTLGCEGPKSMLVVKSEECFLDLVIKNLKKINKKFKSNIPLILMNSFNTEKKTAKFLRKYNNIKTFNQSCFPRISSSNLLPIDLTMGSEALYPPGHGDLLISLEKSGLLDELLKEGKEYLFISNIDNLGADFDQKILKYFSQENLDFLMELTEKTRNDIKGGTLINYKNKLKLLEIAQVPIENLKDFTSNRLFKIFNTNNIWINLKSLKKLSNEDIKLDIIENKKKLSNGEEVIQLETAIGAAISLFKKTSGLIVSRDRFRPVKNVSDLFIIRSNLFKEKGGLLKINKKRINKQLPNIKLLGEDFKDVNCFDEMFKDIPNLLELDHLTVYGNVYFGKNITLKGTVIIIAGKNQTIRIPENSILEDNIIYGNLPIIEY